MPPDWFWKPEVLYSTALSLLLFVFAAVLSAYPEMIRRSLNLLGRRASRLSAKMLLSRIATLQRLKANAYELMLWLLLMAINSLRDTFSVAAAFFTVEVIGHFLFHKLLLPWSIAPNIMLTPATLRGVIVYNAIRDLSNYDVRFAQLNEALAGWQRKFQLSTETLP